jgi:hypothetical protein
MRTSRLILTSFALAALVGCADNTTAGDDDGDGFHPPPPPPRTIDPTGAYRVHSTYDLAASMPGGAGTFVNGLIDATNDPDDPMLWVLDRMISTLPDGTAKDILNGAKPFVAPFLNQKLTELAPNLVNTITTVGHRMADLTKDFGLSEKLDVLTSTDQTYLAQIFVDGVRFKVDTNYVDVAFIDHDMDDVVVSGVPVTYGNMRLGLGDHAVPLQYGKIVRLGLDVAIIPAIDPAAHNLTEMLDHVVDCTGVGANVAQQLGFGSAAFWKSVCLAGLQQAADAVYNQIAAADSSLDIHRTGSARAADTNDDYKLDKLTFGEWSGKMSYSGADAPIVQPATFEGSRFEE